MHNYKLLTLELEGKRRRCTLCLSNFCVGHTFKQNLYFFAKFLAQFNITQFYGILQLCPKVLQNKAYHTKSMDVSISWNSRSLKTLKSSLVCSIWPSIIVH